MRTAKVFFLSDEDEEDDAEGYKRVSVITFSFLLLSTPNLDVSFIYTTFPLVCFQNTHVAPLLKLSFYLEKKYYFSFFYLLTCYCLLIFK